MPYNKYFIDQASSVKMAEYWPRSLFAFLWTETKYLYLLKENQAQFMNIVSLPDVLRFQDPSPSSKESRLL